MKLRSSLITSTFPQEDIRALELACDADKVILVSLEKLLRLRLDRYTTPTKDSDFDNPSWAYQRAYRDGRVIELVELLELITKE
jgi:hypothetical protein